MQNVDKLTWIVENIEFNNFTLKNLILVIVIVVPFISTYISQFMFNRELSGNLFLANLVFSVICGLSFAKYSFVEWIRMVNGSTFVALGIPIIIQTVIISFAYDFNNGLPFWLQILIIFLTIMFSAIPSILFNSLYLIVILVTYRIITIRALKPGKMTDINVRGSNVLYPKFER